MTTIKTTENGVRYLDLFAIFPTAFSDKYHAKRSYTACIVCARDTSKQDGSFGVVIGGGGGDIIHPSDADIEESDPGFMGCFPIGSECIKVLPAEFRVRIPLA